MDASPDARVPRPGHCCTGTGYLGAAPFREFRSENYSNDGTVQDQDGTGIFIVVATRIVIQPTYNHSAPPSSAA